MKESAAVSYEKPVDSPGFGRPGRAEHLSPPFALLADLVHFGASKRGTIVQSGYVASLEVLGLSESNREGPERNLDEYLKCIRDAIEDPRVEYLALSDGVVLTSAGAGIDSLLVVAKATSRLFHNLLRTGLSVRGAISHGSFSRFAVADSACVAGPAVADAGHFEQQQDWVGVMLAPSARAQVAKLDELCNLKFKGQTDFAERVEWAAVLQPCHSIAFRPPELGEPGAYDGFAIVPLGCRFEVAGLMASIRDAVQQLVWLRGLAPSPVAQLRYQRAFTWLSEVHSKWWQMVPTLVKSAGR